MKTQGIEFRIKPMKSGRKTVGWQVFAVSFTDETLQGQPMRFYALQTVPTQQFHQNDCIVQGKPSAKEALEQARYFVRMAVGANDIIKEFTK